MNSAISSSPTRKSTLETPGVSRGHKHRRSAAISSHDLSSIMGNAEPQPRLSSSLPSTPLEHPIGMADTFGDLYGTSKEDSASDPFGPSLANAQGRPPSRRQVGFSENVEYIPRPLSTISSETESSLNTVRGHSVNNSISSMLSLSTPSPSAPRTRAISLETTLEDEPRLLPRSSVEVSKRVEREGEWLKHGSSGALDRPATASDVLSKSLTFATEDVASRARKDQVKKHSASRSLGFDRRKSEPAIGMHTKEPSRLSALSLQETTDSAVNPDDDTAAADRRSSTRKIKDWAVSKIVRRARPRSEVIMPRPLTIHEPQRSVAETDLDAVFNMDNDADVMHDRAVMPEVQLNMHMPVLGSQSIHRARNSEDGAMLDLDDALGRPRTPTQYGSRRPRKMLHSDRGTLDFMGPGAHYQPMHHRTASAPVLMAFDQPRTSSPPQPALAVFEEEEEEQVPEVSLRPSSIRSATDEESATGVSIVDQDASLANPTPTTSLDEGLGIQRSEWDLEPPAYVSSGSNLSTPLVERRASSIIEQTIMEETSPVDSVAIVHNQDPWEEEVDLRAHSLTKSSDSSEAPTLMAVPTGLLSISDGTPVITTPEVSQSSAFSSPDFARRQGSFDTSRVGTSASSIADTRTVSSCTTGEPQQDPRMSVDDVPSLTSSRSTMISTMHANSSRRDVAGLRTPSFTSGSLDSAAAESRRRKRASLQSLSQLVGGPFGPRPAGTDDTRPSTAATETALSQTPRKKEHRLKKLMFWKSKRQFSTSTIN